MSSIWNAIKDIVANGLGLLHGWIEPLPLIGGDAAWGWAIIALTVFVRILLIPLAVKQFHSMRAMQELQPQIKALQKKHKVDRSMMRSDPEKYRKLQARKNEQLQALYKENQVNPAAGCLPLLAQGPVFFALYSVLRDPETLGGRLFDASFYMFESLGETASVAGIAGYALIILVAASMFVSQKQMMGRNTSAAGNDAQATQQKVMLYVMPLMMGFFGYQLPVGVLLYWVTTNVWTMVQQAIIMREATEEAQEMLAERAAANAGGPVEGAAGNIRGAQSGGSSNGSAPSTSQRSSSSRDHGAAPSASPGDKGTDKSGKSPDSSTSSGRGATSSKRSGKRSNHLPSRPSRRD